ncbi:putative zinc finger/helix-turn-helix YgiT family protein [Anoxybacillus calidus]|uniref:Putative zinc finger/helix-turn-helix YgiT family protein n=1 Tax=[Anoxybacillus] calidus TaxID=575178 RepID=A0A7V9Z357_9BACL|nr:type II TA system antitoxin MqsA family protein [Anoxybacillus calidus]MBA2873166.1 putative zinc finger/helix-turn-helix YgiT family protein [Anoxybacillus calidus]
MNNNKGALEKFCPDCLDYTSMKPIKLKKIFQVKDENIEIEADYLECQECKNVVPDPQLEEKNYQRVYTEYRNRKGLLQPSEIIALRNKYGISQRQLAKILGWSHVTLSRYESGAIQSSSHNNELVLILENPKNLLRLLELNASNLSAKEVEKLRSKISMHIYEKDTLSEVFENCLKKEKNIYTGFKEFDLNKFIHVVKFFAIRDPELYKVKLMKYLWYSDFLNFKRNTLSITGLRYVRLPMGPVPDEHDLLIAMVLKTGEISREYIDFGYPNLAELFKSKDSHLDESVFETEELEVLHDVYEALKHHSSKSISNYSHHESGWLNTEENNPISYEYAFELSLS